MEWINKILAVPVINLVAGNVLGVLLNWLFAPPKRQELIGSVRARDTNILQAGTIENSRIQIGGDTHINVQAGQRQSGDLDPREVLGFCMVAVVVTCLVYVFFGSAVTNATKFLAWTVFGFSVMFAARRVASMQSLELREVWASSLPIAVSVSQLLLAEKAERFLRAYDSMPRRNLQDLKRYWTHDQLVWVTLQGFGLVTALGALILVFGFVLKQSQLKNPADRYPGLTTNVRILAMSGLAWFLISGHAFSTLKRFVSF
ncbi:hypothetical protein [Brucella intermedia]|uniref:hypothetical protein n=1 Tax=Brucella intermedia TaxID=94625 RepID=UPI0023622DEF|nr:hypothetical protein [Brucella intermedia]